MKLKSHLQIEVFNHDTNIPGETYTRVNKFLKKKGNKVHNISTAIAEGNAIVYIVAFWVYKTID